MRRGDHAVTQTVLRQRPERLIQSFSGATLLLSTTPRSPDPTNHLGTRLSSAQRAFEAAAIFSRADGFIRPALTCSVISWRLAGSAHLARMAAAIPLRLSGFAIPAMSLLRSSGSAHLARITAVIRLRRSGLLVAAMNLLRSSGSSQRALVSALFRSRLA